MASSGIEILPYSPEWENEWNSFVENSKNGTFLFNRGYMDYHAERFKDNSLIIRIENKTKALFPAILEDNMVYSHKGLTYGGLLMDKTCTQAEILRILSLIIEIYRNRGIEKLYYKAIPYIYTLIPSQEDLYAIFRLGATLCVRNVASVIDFYEPLKFKELRRRGMRKALKNNITIRQNTNFEPFWNILTQNLDEKYKAKPVHSLSEISLLASRFPENIKLFEADLNGECVGGAVVFISHTCTHVQYISASSTGKQLGVLDLLFNNIITEASSSQRYFDFGTSNENGGRYLNESLIYQKEGFGGRAVCYDTYEIKL